MKAPLQLLVKFSRQQLFFLLSIKRMFQTVKTATNCTKLLHQHLIIMRKMLLETSRFCLGDIRVFCWFCFESQTANCCPDLLWEL